MPWDEDTWGAYEALRNVLADSGHIFRADPESARARDNFCKHVRGSDSSERSEYFLSDPRFHAHFPYMLDGA